MALRLLKSADTTSCHGNCRGVVHVDDLHVYGGPSLLLSFCHYRNCHDQRVLKQDLMLSLAFLLRLVSFLNRIRYKERGYRLPLLSLSFHWTDF